MTAKAVADDVLGRITRKVMDLLRRTLEGSVDVWRVLFFLQRAIENPPTRKVPGPGESAIYMLECHWAYDKPHYEYVTFTLEWCEALLLFEDLFKPGLSVLDRDFLMSTLRRVFEAQIPDHGTRRMMRLYRVGYCNRLGAREALLSEPLRDIHFSLEPICEFNVNGEPVPVGTEGAATCNHCGNTGKSKCGMCHGAGCTYCHEGYLWCHCETGKQLTLQSGGRLW